MKWLNKLVAKRAIEINLMSVGHYKVPLTTTCKYHPPLVNRRCHENTRWHLLHTPEVVEVAKGFYLLQVYEANAHFICKDVYGNWFDPTLPLSFLDKQKFYITEIFDENFDANAELKKEKERLNKLAPFFLRKFVDA